MRLEDLPAVAGVEHRFLSAGGSRIHVAEAGAGEAVLMLHGWPQHWYLWRDVIPRLADGRRVLCPDMPGFGWSDPPPEPPRGYLKERLAGQLLALLDELGLERVSLVGHDWGGWLGFLMCLRAPERFSRFLAIDIPPPFQRMDPRSALGLWRLSYQAVIAAPVLGEQALRRGRFHELLMRAGVGPDYRWPPDVLEAFSAPVRTEAGARATVALYRTFLTRELWPVAQGAYRSQDLRVPTLLLVGALDPVVKGALRDLPRESGSSGSGGGMLTLEVVPRVGHFLVDERPELVAARAVEQDRSRERAASS